MRFIKTIILPLKGAALRRIVCDEPPPAPPPAPRLPTEAQIDARLKAHAESRGMAIDLNSIVNLLQLLDIRNDFASRNSLWIDLGHGGHYSGSAEQNMVMLAEVRHLWATGDL